MQHFVELRWLQVSWQYQTGIAKCTHNLASATDFISLGTLLGTSNLLKMLKRHTDCMQVHCTVCRHPILARICRSEGSKVSRALHLVGQKHLELLLLLGLLSCVAHMMPAIHEFLHSDC